MGNEQINYHRQREQQCRSLAETSPDPKIRRLHEELAQLHASRAEQPMPPEVRT